MKLVFVELSDEERNRVSGNRAAIDALGQSLGPEVAAALGGYVKGWHPISANTHARDTSSHDET
jgi:hypothetical protein